MLASEKFASTGDGTKLILPFPIYINDLVRSMQADGWFFRVKTVQWNLLLRHDFEFLFPNDLLSGLRIRCEILSFVGRELLAFFSLAVIVL